MEIINFKDIDSTQKYAKKLACEGIADTLIHADTQNSGVGRKGNTWVSPRGGLWFSFIMSTKGISTDKLLICTLMVGTVVLKSCKSAYKIELKLKWPNDLIIDQKKVAGIICELVDSDKLVIGIGINTNFDKSELNDIANSATFMSETGREVDNNKLMENIVEEIFKSFNELIEKGPEDILSFFKENMAFLEEKRYVSAINKEALIKGISNKGYLLIQDDGKEKEIFFGMI